MQVQFSSIFSNISIQNKKYGNPILYTTGKLNSLNNDIFVRSNSVSFKGAQNKDNNKIDIKDTIIGASAVGAMFMIPLVTSIAIAKNQNPDDIFLSDGTYLGNADELFVDTQKASELGVDLNPERFKAPYCFCDEMNGIFRDFKNGVDINLKEGKYVDLNNGIYVNPEDNTSVICTNGETVPLVLPAFGSGYPTRPEDDRWHDYRPPRIESREEYIKEHGTPPESSDTPYVFSSEKDFSYYNFSNIERFTPIDRRNLFEKTKDFFNGDNDTQIKHDFWGREIITLQDKMGQKHYVALTDDLSQRMYDEHISYETVQAFLTHAAEHPIQNYIKENYADFIHNMHFENPSMESFLENIKNNDSDYSDVSSHANAEPTDDISHVDTNDEQYDNHDNSGDYIQDYHSTNDDISSLV